MGHEGLPTISAKDTAAHLRAAHPGVQISTDVVSGLDKNVAEHIRAHAGDPVGDFSQPKGTTIEGGKPLHHHAPRTEAQNVAPQPIRTRL